LEKVNIVFNKKIIGNISFDSYSEEFSMSYTDEWQKDGFPMSPYLKFNDEIKSANIKFYISNLLPEGESLKDLIELTQISKNDKFGLLKTIGQETTGAFSFISDEESNQETNFREIPQDELEYRIKTRKETPITIWDEKPRMSIAGVQEKLGVAIIDGKMGLADGDLASTHILKFGKKDHVYNEFLSLQLASLSDIVVNESQIVQCADEVYLRVKRFDRIIHSNKYIEKLHIIDSCQMLNLPPEFKYEKVDVRANQRVGVNLKKLFGLIDYTNTPFIDKNKIIDWVCMNLCLANADAHGKNISFRIQKDSIEITPFYDIMNISLLAHSYKDELAMAIDDEFIILNIKAHDIREFCSTNKIATDFFMNRFNTIAKSIIENLNTPEKFGFDLSSDKLTFFETYKKNTLYRIYTLQSAFVYLKAPTNSTKKTVSNFLKKHKKDIDNLLGINIHDNDMHNETIMDNYLEVLSNNFINKRNAI
jgi:serine/threonine-protein kinase HipA